jgi:TolA-binding protein
MRNLLIFGADPNSFDVAGKTSLYYAVQNRDQGPGKMRSQIEQLDEGEPEEQELEEQELEEQELEEQELEEQELEEQELEEEELEEAEGDEIWVLINGGANMEICGRGGRVPLHCAAMTGNTAATAILLQAGANIEAHQFITLHVVEVSRSLRFC